MKTYIAMQNIGTFSKSVPTCSYCEGFVLTKHQKLKAVLRPYLSEVLQLFPLRKLIKRLFIINHARLTICLPSAAANSSNITSMPQVDRGGSHEDYTGNEVVKCSVRLPHQRPVDTGPHRETAARSKMHRMSAGRGLRYTSRSEAEGVRHGRWRVHC